MKRDGPDRLNANGRPRVEEEGDLVQSLAGGRRRRPMKGDSTPVVSIVLPAWNRREFIARAIRSVQAQTLSDWEMVVVDDCSGDGTEEVVRRILEDRSICNVRVDRN